MTDLQILSEPQQERFLLGCMMIDEAACRDVRAIVKAGDLFLERHQAIYHIIADLRDAGKPVDPFFVSEQLRIRGELKEGDALYIGKAISDLPTTLHAETYAQTVKQLAIRREMALEAGQMAQAAHDLELDIDVVRARADTAFQTVNWERAPGISGLLTAADILTTDYPDPVWAIPSMLPTGLTLLAGKPKLGKSWLALQIALSVASGGFALGEHIEQGPVLYLALEDSARRLKSRMIQQGWTIDAGALMDVMPLGRFVDEIGDLRDGGGVRLANQIERMGYRFVVIDTLSRSCYGDQNDAQQMTRALTPLQEMGHEKNCAIFLTDHHRKGFGADPDAVGDILGSTAKGAMADTLWGLYRERGKSDAKLQITGRDIEERNLKLSWHYDTGCWQLEGDADAIRLTERRREILDILETLGRAGVVDIAKEIGQKKGNVYNRLLDLVSAGLVLREKVGNSVYYELSGRPL